MNKERQLAKSTNKWGNPIALKGKIVAAIADPHSNSCIYAAEATGNVRKVDLGVSLAGPFDVVGYHLTLSDRHCQGRLLWRQGAADVCRGRRAQQQDAVCR